MYVDFDGAFMICAKYQLRRWTWLRMRSGLCKMHDFWDVVNGCVTFSLKKKKSTDKDVNETSLKKKGVKKKLWNLNIDPTILFSFPYFCIAEEIFCARLRIRNCAISFFSDSLLVYIYMDRIRRHESFHSIFWSMNSVGYGWSLTVVSLFLAAQCR